METSPWRQKRSSSAKMDSAAEMLHGSSRRIKGKARIVPPGSGVKPERARKSLNEKLSTVVLDSHTKDRRMSVCSEKGAEEMFLKDGDLGNESEANTRLSTSRDASDELLKQLECLLKDHGRTANITKDDVMIESKSERKQPEMKGTLENLASENHRLRNSLVVKEKLVETLNDRKAQLESEFEALMGRLDSIEKENAFLRYEYHVLEKDLEVRTEEMEYARRSIDLAHKQQLKSVNKIVELEAECQRLRLLIRKKFPDATILLQPKLRSEEEERKMEMRRRNVNIQNDFAIRDEIQNQKLHHDLLMEQISNIREENKNLKEIILKQNTEIKDLSRGQNQMSMDLAKKSRSPTFHEFSSVGNFDVGSEDGVSSSGSLSKALVSEPRDEKCKISKGCRVIRSSEMSLYMEDFAEMEKFAIVSTDKNPREEEEDQPFDWLQVVLSAISKQQRISKQGVKELLEDIKIALGCMDSYKETKKPEDESAPLCITWKSPAMSPESGSMTKEEIKRHLGLSTRNLTTDGESFERQKVSQNDKQDLREENNNLKDEMKKIDSESKELRLKLKESEEKIKSLETEMKTLKESKDIIEAEIETEKTINEDLDTELSVTRAKLNETQQKLSSLEIELDFRKSCCEELEGTCLELQLQLESVEKREPPKYSMERNRKKSQTGWDMAAASMKLAECQETILNLRKQLKALALPSNLSVLSSETSNITKFGNKGSSLRDQMIIEDNTKKPQKKHTVRHDDDSDDDGDKNCNALIVYTPRVYSIKDDEERREGLATMAIVQSHKKQGSWFLKKLLFRRRRGTSKKCLALTM